MPELYQLEQLVSVAKYGNLSKAAEELHISQPALSRSMQKLENELKVSLFERQKNKIALSPIGELAVEYAQKVLDQMQDMINRVRSFDRSLHTISVGSCAPAPLWDIVPVLSSSYSDMTVSCDIKDQDKLVQGLADRTYQIIITTFPIRDPDVYCTKFGEERLFFSLPPGHALSSAKGLHFKDLDGETMLLYSKIGFWHEVHQQEMPSAHFLLQEERFAFTELVRASALPAFTSDLALKSSGNPDNRVIIPILDESAHVVYYCSCLSGKKKKLSAFLGWVRGRVTSPETERMRPL